MSAPARAQSKKKPRRRLCVVSQRLIASFDNKQGEKSHLFAVDALDENHRRVSVPLRSFQELPIDELREYEVSTYEHERYGISYTLQLPRQALQPQLEQLRRWLGDLTVRVDQLELAVRPQPGGNGSANSRWGSDPPF